MKIWSGVGFVMLTIWHTPAVANSFPSRSDVEERIPSEVCYDIVLKITRYSDLHQYPDHRIPLCYDLSTVFAASGASDDCMTGQYPSCFISPSALGTQFTTVSTPRYRFAAKFLWGGDGGTSLHYSRQPNNLLMLDFAIGLGANWDLRMNQILYAHRDELPVRLPTIVLPSIITTLSGGATSKVWAMWPDATHSLEPTSNSPIGRVFGVGYDESNETYDVDISEELKSVKYVLAK